MIKGAARSPLLLLGGLLTIYLAVPIVAFLVRFLGSANRGFSTPGLYPSLIISLESATISLALITLLGVPLAYLLARSKGRVASVVGVVVLLPLALPPLMSGILLIYLVGPYTFLGRLFDGYLTNSLTGVVIAQTFCAAPFLITAARSAFETVDTSLLHVAATLGHSETSRFLRVALPLAGPGIRAGMLLAWLRAFGEYGAVIVLAYHPFSLPVYTYNQFSGVGLPTTLAPTGLALGVAALAVVISRARPRRPGRLSVLPSAVPPPPIAPAPAGFDLDFHLGTFHLSVAHRPDANHLGVLGSSGSGKSALLRSLAGFHGTAPGPVFYGDDEVTGVPVETRHVGYVAQGFSLFPHLTVWEHLLFGVGVTPGLAAYWLAELKLSGLQDRYPSELSGGQRQRVALAQAFCRSPGLLLLDEPFSALDAPVRQELRRVVRRLQHDTGAATVIVTHDPEEAAFLADELIMIGEGELLQAGVVRTIFDRPASPEVAHLLGIPNLFRGVMITEATMEVGGHHIAVNPNGLAPGTIVEWSIQPEHVAVMTGDGVPGVLTDIADVGVTRHLEVSLAPDVTVVARTSDTLRHAIGDPVALVLPPDAITLWEAGVGEPADFHS